ncbi:unnamed protein product [Amoebophrya sp. A25]|nr:unnamed protein product [Amoebophrya sp. A25]|eukprot:GSA25T00016808001.1
MRAGRRGMTAVFFSSGGGFAGVLGSTFVEFHQIRDNGGASQQVVMSQQASQHHHNRHHNTIGVSEGGVAPGTTGGGLPVVPSSVPSSSGTTINSATSIANVNDPRTAPAESSTTTTADVSFALQQDQARGQTAEEVTAEVEEGLDLAESEIAFAQAGIPPAWVRRGWQKKSWEDDGFDQARKEGEEGTKNRSRTEEANAAGALTSKPSSQTRLYSGLRFLTANGDIEMLEEGEHRLSKPSLSSRSKKSVEKRKKDQHKQKRTDVGGFDKAVSTLASTGRRKAMPRVFLGVLAGPGEQKRRNRWRETCLPRLQATEKHYQSQGQSILRWRFFVGEPDAYPIGWDRSRHEQGVSAPEEVRKMARDLLAESEKYGDIYLTFNPDHYISTYQKTLEIFRVGSTAELWTDTNGATMLNTGMDMKTRAGGSTPSESDLGALGATEDLSMFERNQALLEEHMQHESLSEQVEDKQRAGPTPPEFVAKLDNDFCFQYEHFSNAMMNYEASLLELPRNREFKPTVSYRPVKKSDGAGGGGAFLQEQAESATGDSSGDPVVVKGPAVNFAISLGKTGAVVPKAIVPAKAAGAKLKPKDPNAVAAVSTNLHYDAPALILSNAKDKKKRDELEERLFSNSLIGKQHGEKLPQAPEIMAASYLWTGAAYSIQLGVDGRFFPYPSGSSEILSQKLAYLISHTERVYSGLAMGYATSSEDTDLGWWIHHVAEKHGVNVDLLDLGQKLNTVQGLADTHGVGFNAAVKNPNMLL